MFPVQKLGQEGTELENMCDIVLEKAKSHGEIVNKMKRFSKKDGLRNSQENTCTGDSEHHRTTAFDHSKVNISEEVIDKQNCTL